LTKVFGMFGLGRNRRKTEKFQQEADGVFVHGIYNILWLVCGISPANCVFELIAAASGG
jgi:hypothetical protein